MKHMHLLIMDEINRSDYDSDIVYSIGDPITFLAGEFNDTLWQVILTDYEIVEDIHDVNKKALVLHFNYQFLMQDFMMAPVPQPVIEPMLFYYDIALKPQSLAEATIAYNLGNYSNSPHILYEPFVNDEMICKLVTLTSNIEQTCFSYYSYAGPGEYLISFENGNKEHFNYLLSIHEEVEISE